MPFMAMSDTLNVGSTSPSWRDYLTLTKPRVVAVLVLTSMVGMLLARPVLPSVELFILANLGIGLAASAAAAVNHVVDRRIDAVMSRTRHRPVCDGKVSVSSALLFAFVLGTSGLSMLIIVANPLTALLTFASIIGYAVIYTLYLKRATPQNIVIGGVAGASPPLLGWVAVTGTIDAHALLLVAIIFAWTPPHFWALCIAKKEDYANADVPMLPVTHGDAAVYHSDDFGHRLALPDWYERYPVFGGCYSNQYQIFCTIKEGSGYQRCTRCYGSLLVFNTLHYVAVSIFAGGPFCRRLTDKIRT